MEKEKIHVTTKTGFEVDVDSGLSDDWELVEALKDSKTDGVQALFKVLDVVLTKKQYKDLKEHCRIDGHVSAKQMEAEIEDILSGLGKNS